jgi:excisionase family DNA binding protein
MSHGGILNMRTYSVSEAAKAAGVDRRTLQRWIAKKQIPSPRVEIVDGQLRKSWSAAEIAEIREYKKANYWGKGLDRRTGKKAKKK